MTTLGGCASTLGSFDAVRPRMSALSSSLSEAECRRCGGRDQVFLAFFALPLFALAFFGSAGFAALAARASAALRIDRA